MTDPTKTHHRWLTEIRLVGFKAAFKPEPIPLSPFNVIIGRNGSGKSTLLEALQWIDTAVRVDARAASARYFGARDLIHFRSRDLRFQLGLTWGAEGRDPDRLRYLLEVAADEPTGAPVISSEQLFREVSGKDEKVYLTTENGSRRLGSAPPVIFRDPDRLALGLVSSTGIGQADAALKFLEEFWANAVFLRLSPNRLAGGSLATRRSFEPLLDEEGQNLPALLNELSAKQKQSLVRSIREILPEIRDVEVSGAEHGRDTKVNYSLVERVPYLGRRNRKQFSIPSWMLSEGTRRITAILALLAREPAPSLLCIEEIENGLDPWTAQAILLHLRSAAERGTQVILTTHSPWVLDFVPIDSILQARRIEGESQYGHFASRPEIQAYDPSVPAGTRYVNEAE